MTIVKEIEQVIAELPPQKAFMLRYWLNEYHAARRYKKLKAYTLAVKTLANFKKSKSNALLN